MFNDLYDKYGERKKSLSTGLTLFLFLGNKRNEIRVSPDSSSYLGQVWYVGFVHILDHLPRDQSCFLSQSCFKTPV